MTTPALLALADRWEKSADDFLRLDSDISLAEAAVMRVNAAELRRTLAAPSAGVGERVSLREELQKQCSDWGTYWRAPDSHGVELSHAQAVELLENALGVEVEIAANTPPQVEYDRGLIAKMLNALITFGDKLAGFTYRSINDQIALLRAADNRDAAGVRTVNTPGDAEAVTPGGTVDADDMPGMWDRSDMSGGESDTYRPSITPRLDDSMLGRAIDAYNAEYRGTQAAWMKSALTAALKGNNNG